MIGNKNSWQQGQRVLHSLLPGFRAAEYLYADKLVELAKEGVRWLDAGCGRGVLPAWMRQDQPGACALLHPAVGMDTNTANLKTNRDVRTHVVGALEHCPFGANSFDLVTARFVMEHVEDIHGALSEFHRILAPGGLFLFHTPNRLNYQVGMASLVPQRWKNRIIRLLEGREDDDIFPVRYRLNTARCVRAQSAKCGFRVRELIFADSNPETMGLGPFVLPEALVTKLLSWEPLAGLRSTIIAVLEKPVMLAGSGTSPMLNQEAVDGTLART